MTNQPMRQVREICDLVTKGTTPTTIGRGFTSRGVKFIKVETIAPDGRFIVGREAYIDSDTHAILRRSQLAEGDILFSIAGALGRTTVVEGSWLPANTNQAFAIIRPARRHKEIDPRYLLWQLRSPAIAKTISEINVQAAQANLSLEQVRNFEIPFAPLREQQAIVASLDDVDDLIANLGRQIAKKQAIKQGMIQQLLTSRTRLPGFDGPWREARLGSLLKRPPRYGINAAAVSVSVDTHTYIRITDIDDSGRFTPHPRVGVRHRNAADYLLHDGELVFARTGASVGKSYLYDSRDGVLVYAGFLINIAPNPEVLEPKYLAFFAQTTRYWDWVSRTSVRSGQPGINGREYAQLQIAVPGIREQQAIVGAVQKVDEEVRLLDKRLAKVEAVRQGMMQQLLTGRTRLPVAEDAA